MRRVFALSVLAAIAAGCSAIAGATPDPSEAEGPGVPMACFGLQQPDCARAFEAAVLTLDPGAQVVYAEVGPFGCPNEAGCPNSLAARPSGQVVFEIANGDPVAIAVRAAADDTLTAGPGESFTVAVSPTSVAGQLTGEPIPYALGHCGVNSGIDVDGSWWDPVGFVDIDHGDSINAASGTFAPIDSNHATFTSDGGFSVTVVRRVGDKHLPMCM